MVTLTLTLMSLQCQTLEALLAIHFRFTRRFGQIRFLPISFQIFISPPDPTITSRWLGRAIA